MKQIIEDKTYTSSDFSEKAIDNCSFSYCKFSECKFVETAYDDVSFNECIFENCSFVNGKFSDTVMKFCTFRNCSIIGLNWMELSTSYSAVIEKLDRCLLKYNNFEDMTFRKIDFGKSQIISSAFYKTTLSECNFSECNLKDTTFSMCDLQKSDFRSAQGFGIDIMTCKLKGAKFSFSNLVGLVNGLGIKIE